MAFSYAWQDLKFCLIPKVTRVCARKGPTKCALPCAALDLCSTPLKAAHSPVLGRSMVTVKDTITLNDAEKELFDTLLKASKHAGSTTVLRCAGGWVRDKLLGKDGLDIDLALDNKLGKEFAEQVNAYLTSLGMEVRTAAVIQSNPEQSKHLETARMKINNMWIDLVNLRSETYAQESRIPTMQFGTPEQDAMRRDFTINSLFYNINEGMVEDFTGRGMEDLRTGIIRTPLPPKETFMDDPLRVLRAVRFATRFSFDMEPSLTEAAASEEVRQALAHKVSKERVGTELEGMFNGPAPVEAVKTLHRLLLFPIVFELPAQVRDRLGPSYGGPCVATMSAAYALMQAQGVQLDKEERRFFLLAALLLPLRNMQAASVKGKPMLASTHIVRESLKWRAKDAETVQLLHETAERLLDVHRKLVPQSQGQQLHHHHQASDDVRVALGNIIRKLKQHWKLGVVLAPVLTTQAAAPMGLESTSAVSGSSSSVDGGHSQEEVPPSQLQGLNEMCNVLLSAAEAFKLQNCWQWKPLLDGKQVMQAAGLQKPGPELGKIMAAAVDWQLCHPDGNAEQCTQFIRDTFKPSSS